MSEGRFRRTEQGVWAPESAAGRYTQTTDRLLWLPTPRPVQALDAVQAYLCAREGLGDSSPPDMLIAYVRMFGKWPLLETLATLAGEVANNGHDSREVVERLRRPLEALTDDAAPKVRALARYVRAHPDRVFVHEKVIYALQALAILEGTDSGVHPSRAQLAIMLLMANDHLDVWATPEGTSQLSLSEKNAAVCAWEARFNANSDRVATLVRAYELFQLRPESGPFASEDGWSELQQKAFGRPFVDYFLRQLAPIWLQSFNWGVQDDPIASPVLHETHYPAGSALWSRLEASASPLTSTVEMARAHFEKELVFGLPRTTAYFVGKPILRTPTGGYLVLSPWLMRAQIELGVWNRLPVFTLMEPLRGRVLQPHGAS